MASRALVTVLLLAPFIFSLPAAAREKGYTHVAAATMCRQAVAQSRMICLSGSNCQREISPILRACGSSTQAACLASREDVRSHCAAQTTWQGSRECEGALQQVSHYCGR